MEPLGRLKNKTKQNIMIVGYRGVKTITDQELLPPLALRLLAAPCIVAFTRGHSGTLQRVD